jgi:hypothetical protein
LADRQRVAAARCCGRLTLKGSAYDRLWSGSSASGKEAERTDCCCNLPWVAGSNFSTYAAIEKQVWLCRRSLLNIEPFLSFEVPCDRVNRTKVQADGCRYAFCTRTARGKVRSYKAGDGFWIRGGLGSQAPLTTRYFRNRAQHHRLANQQLSPETLACNARAFSHRRELRPHHVRIDGRLADPGAESAIASRDHVFPTDQFGIVADAVGN